MITATSYSISPDTISGLTAAYTDLVGKLGGSPTWMAVHGTYQHSGEVITNTLNELAPGIPFQGGTSCLGVMTEAGFHSDEGMSLGLFGIRDSEGVYGVGYAEEPVSARRLGQIAIKRAMENAGKKQPPALVWITCFPGDEEGIISGIEAGLEGAAVPIIGGSSADNALEHKWYQMTNGQVLSNGVVVTAMFPSRPVRYAFENSYVPTEHKGIVTKAAGRVIQEINRRPAAEVYNEWTNGIISDCLGGGNILSLSTLYPLGRRALWNTGTVLYQLSHPEAVVEKRALALFTRVERGDEIILMQSSTRDLVSRVERVTTKGLVGITAPEKQVAGALVIYCAGCMLAIRTDMQAVAEKFCRALGGKPFLGLYTFGEQGCALLGENKHANLMMSMVVFEQ